MGANPDMNRNKLIDALKGYACLLVVFGHVIIGIRTSGAPVPAFMETAERFIWSFHIDLFMFLSGFVYTLTGGRRGKGRLAFLRDKLLSLGIPYLFFSCLYITVNCLAPGVNNPASFTDMLFLWRTPIAQYWFLYALLWLFVLWTLLPDRLPNAAKTALLYGVFLLCKVLDLDMGVLDSSMNCVLAFGLGTCLHSLPIERVPLPARLAVLPVHVGVTLWAIGSGWINRLLADDLVTVLGIAASVCFIYTVTRAAAVRRFLEFICKYSFQIYLLHTFFTAAVRILLFRLGIASYPVHVLAGTVIGVALPIGAAALAARSPYTEFFFFPKRALAAIRARRAGAAQS